LLCYDDAPYLTQGSRAALASFEKKLRPYAAIQTKQLLSGHSGGEAYHMHLDGDAHSTASSTVGSGRSMPVGAVGLPGMSVSSEEYDEVHDDVLEGRRRHLLGEGELNQEEEELLKPMASELEVARAHLRRGNRDTRERK
jgi:hypothetical protein